MVALSSANLLEQDKMAVKRLNPTGDIVFVGLAADGATDGNSGGRPEHAVLTLGRAYALAGVGDSIILPPGGSETVTAAISLAKAGLFVFCRERGGYTVTAAGTLNCISVEAADCHLEGIKTAHTGATSNQAGVVTTAAADRLVLKRCIADDSAIVTNFTGQGFEITNGCDDVLVTECMTLDCLYGGQVTVATGTTCLRPRFEKNEFYTGRANAFGLDFVHAGTGVINGARVIGNVFMEAIGSGAVAASAWDGTDNTDATQGTIQASAGCDQLLVEDNIAHTALAQLFSTLGAVNAGAASSFVNNRTSTGESVTAVKSDTQAIETTVTTIASDVVILTSDLLLIESDIVAMQPVLTTVASDIVVVISDTIAIEAAFVSVQSDTLQIQSDTTAIHLQTTQILSDTLQIQSDTTSINTQTTTIASDVVILTSDLLLIESDVVAMQPVLTTVASDIVILTSDLLLIESDVVAMQPVLTTVASDVVILDSWQRRTIRSAAVPLTGGSVQPVFTISGGPILMLGLFAHVDTVVDAPCTAKWQLNPTVGGATDLCSTVEANTDAIGDVFYVEGAGADALVRAANGTVCALGIQDGHGVFLMPGAIDLILQNSDPTTGEWDVYMVYIPLMAASAVA